MMRLHGFRSAAEWLQSCELPAAEKVPDRVAPSLEKQQLAARLETSLRRAIVHHPSAGVIFTSIPGGSALDRRNRGRAKVVADSSGLVSWADALLHLSDAEPNRWVLAAHARMLTGDHGGALRTLQRALRRCEGHDRVGVIYQNLGVVESWCGRPLDALDAYRRALDCKGTTVQLLAAAALCTVGSKLRRGDSVRVGTTRLASCGIDGAATLLGHTIAGRSRRGDDAFWSFGSADREFLFAHAQPSWGSAQGPIVRACYGL